MLHNIPSVPSRRICSNHQAALYPVISHLPPSPSPNLDEVDLVVHPQPDPFDSPKPRQVFSDPVQNFLLVTANPSPLDTPRSIIRTVPHVRAIEDVGFITYADT